MLSDAAGQWTPWLSTWAGVRPAAEGNLRGDRARFHLGRGRRLRERGQWDDAAREARIALAFDPEDPWAYALLGQSLLHRERPHLLGAQRALRRACSLRPTNGYFVRLLLDAIRADGNDKAYREAVERAWWLGAPVERWLEPATRRKSQVSSPKSQVPRGPGTWDLGLRTWDSCCRGMMRTCLILNPAAGRKAGVTTNAFGLDEARDLLIRHGIEAEILCTERASHATELAEQAVRDGYERILAAGGDGTVAEVAEALIGTGAILGILPLGSIMNIARMLGIPRDLEGAAAVIAAGRAAQIDAGAAQGAARSSYFLEAAGVGIDAGLFAYFNEVDRGNWRSLRPLLTFLWRYRPRRLRLRLDDKPMRVSALMVTVANGPYLGAALTLAPDAKLDDRQFDVRIFTRFSKFELVRHFLSISGGRRSYHPNIMTRKARVVEIAADSPLMAHADSRPLGTTPARFELLPAAISVLVGTGDATSPPALTQQPVAVD